MMSCAERRRHLAPELVDRAGRQAQVDGAAGLLAQPGLFVVRVRVAGRRVALPLHIVERPAQDDRELVDEGRLEGGEPVLREADQRRADRLVRAAFRRQRHARRRRRQDEAGVLVAGVVERIEAAGDERVVERADRDQPLAEQGMRQPERRQQQEQVHLGDAELDMLPLRREVPGVGRGDALGLEQVLHLLAREQAAPVHPRPEIGRDGDVGRGRDDAVRERLARARQLVEDQPEALLRRHRGLLGARERARVGERRAREAARAGAVERHVVEEALELVCRWRQGPRSGPIRGRAARSRSCETPPSASASAGRHGCPCGRRAAGPCP